MRRRDMKRAGILLCTAALASSLHTAARACEGCEGLELGGWMTPPIQPLFPGLQAAYDDALLERHWQWVVHQSKAESTLPDGTRAIEARSTRGDVVLRIAPKRGGYESLDAGDRQKIADALRPMLDGSPPLLRLTVHAKSEEADVWRPVVQMYPGSKPSSSPSPSSPSFFPPAGADDVQARKTEWQRPPRPEGRPVGALTGASIFLSPGHGWWYDGKSWTTQRFNSYGIVEDHSNAETVIQYLVPYLENAGAKVYMARERDMQTNMAVVKSQDAAGGAFVPSIAEAGYYAVYAWYPRAQAKGTIAVKHTGGTTRHKIDATRDFATWTFLGTYWFDAGTNADAGSAIAEGIDVDAIRFGGGMGDFVDGGTTSGKPRWEESGYYYTRFCGFDPKVTGEQRRWNQVHAMPRWAEWEMEQSEGGKSIYIAWHTNASLDHTASGISSYIYSTWGWGPPEFFHGYPGSDRLARFAHNEVLADIRAAWDPKWEDVGIVGRWLGEVNPRSNGTMPAVLLENGFHDNPHDAAYILEPEFRRLAARAAYEGIVRYYASDVPGFGCETMVPEPPKHLRAQVDGHSTATVSWDPVSVRERWCQDYRVLEKDHPLLRKCEWRVYRSRNGKGFDNGKPTRHPAMAITDLAPGEVAYFRVAEVNDGGESLPGETLCVRMPPARDAKRVLFVNGFDRLDRGLNVIEDDGTERGILARMNSRDYCIQHMEALAPLGVAVDSACNEDIARGDVKLSDYHAVVWALGRESTKDVAFDADERQAISEYLAGGGALLVSGSDVAFDLSRTPEGTEFLRKWLRADFVADDSKARDVAPPSNVRSSLAPMRIADRDRGVYDARACDSVRASGSQPWLQWPDGTDAAVVHAGENFRLVYLAFPFEALDHEGRVRTMADAMKILLD